MEKECMNCGGSIYFQCRKEAAKYNDRLSSRDGTSDIDTLDAFEYTWERDIGKYIKKAT